MTMASDPKEALERLRQVARSHPADGPLTCIAVSPEDLRTLIVEREGLEREVERRDAVAKAAWGDQEDEHTAAISAAHPMRTKNHAAFERALAMVGSRHGKYDLVGLANWLLVRAEAAESKLSALKTAVDCFCLGVANSSFIGRAIKQMAAELRQRIAALPSVPPSQEPEDGEPALSEATIAELRRIAAEDHARRHPDVTGLLEALKREAIGWAVADLCFDEPTINTGALGRRFDRALAAFQSRQELRP